MVARNGCGRALGRAENGLRGWREASTLGVRCFGWRLNCSAGRIGGGASCPTSLSWTRPRPVQPPRIELLFCLLRRGGFNFCLEWSFWCVRIFPLILTTLILLRARGGGLGPGGGSGSTISMLLPVRVCGGGG